MPRINVTSPFTLIFDDRTERTFGVGVHEVDDAVAGHWHAKNLLIPESEAPVDEEAAPKSGKGKGK